MFFSLEILNAQHPTPTSGSVSAPSPIYKSHHCCSTYSQPTHFYPPTDHVLQNSSGFRLLVSESQPWVGPTSNGRVGGHADVRSAHVSVGSRLGPLIKRSDMPFWVPDLRFLGFSLKGCPTSGVQFFIMICCAEMRQVGVSSLRFDSPSCLDWRCLALHPSNLS